MIVAFIISFRIRRVPSKFREAKWISLITYNLLLIGLIAVLVLVFLPLSAQVRFAIEAAVTLYLTATMWVLIYVPKVIIPSSYDARENESFSLSSLHFIFDRSLSVPCINQPK